jgi:glycosyltransferase involved in cell wall biosynthesis
MGDRDGRRSLPGSGSVVGRPRAPRALILVEDLPVPFDRRVWTEAKTLRDAGWHVTVISPMGEGARRWHDRIDGIEVFRFPLATTAAGFVNHLIEYAMAIPATLILALLSRLRGPIDAVHACNPPDFFFPIGLLLKRSGAAFIFDQHDLAPEVYLAQGGRKGGLVHRALLWCERQTYRAADVVIATNETYRRFALERGRVKPDRVFVVRTSPDPHRIHAVAPEDALKGGRQHLVVYLGTMGPQDGVDLFLRAAKHLLEARPGAVRFVAIGGGNQLESLRTLAHDLGISEDVLFTGRIDDGTLRRYLSSADIGVSPDPKNGFNEYCTMNKTLEYMASGLPVAAFDLEETRVSAGEAAVYATPNDPRDLARAMSTLLDDPARRSEMAAEGLRRIRGPLSWTRSAEQLLAAYGTATAGRVPRPDARASAETAAQPTAGAGGGLDLQLRNSQPALLAEAVAPIQVAGNGGGPVAAGGRTRSNGSGYHKDKSGTTMTHVRDQGR